MKPRTANEKEVARLAATLPELTPAQQRWIERNAVPAIAYQYRKVNYDELYYEPTVLAWCSNCGQSFEDEPKQQKCPHCGAKFTKHEYKPTKKVSKGRWYTSIITTCDGWQVSRHFIVEHYCRKGEHHGHPAYEVVQIWTNGNGEQVINARAIRPMCGYYDAWSFNSEMSIKRRGEHDQKYDIFSHASKICRVLPILRRNGFRGRFHGIYPDLLFKTLLTDNLAETLIKTGQYALLRLAAMEAGRISRAAAMICVRHGYIVKDATLWRDYIVTCENLGYDIHNPHYACPSDLKKAHDRMLRLKQRRDREREFKLQREKIASAESGYAKRVGRFLGVTIVGSGITIKPMQSVLDVFEEGAAMHHCVFTNKYYEKENTLILSARDDQGQRLETVELELTTGRVVQSRGLNNMLTPRHKEIVDLCESNANRLLKVK